MQIQFNSGSRIDGGADVSGAVEARVRERLARFDGRLTRIEIHVRDVDGDRNGPRGVSARIEARPARGAPVATSDNARTADAAVSGALGKLVSLLDTAFGKSGGTR